MPTRYLPRPLPCPLSTFCGADDGSQVLFPEIRSVLSAWTALPHPLPAPETRFHCGFGLWYRPCRCAVLGLTLLPTPTCCLIPVSIPHLHISVHCSWSRPMLVSFPPSSPTSTPTPDLCLSDCSTSPCSSLVHLHITDYLPVLPSSLPPHGSPHPIFSLLFKPYFCSHLLSLYPK